VAEATTYKDWLVAERQVLRNRATQGGLYQRTVFIFWKPFARNPFCRAIAILQFRKRSSPAVGTLGFM
jgi:hypothetical protein